ncbi:hypothetical protein E8D34_03755 [Nocardioides sp. GY 10113]|uniref:TorD/DmsD family molecular chaperone n=1 Tax=Nocardioides sp. GY 10113 TaxID=2569761 RepID=UPI0010A79B05|nr:molecular chaperone TorD family protein [Nocardioides sp. GY 10113]TIC88786.1 hypothetical protein E8D34_03755 [Nocardioides sp. GY 10113]
MDTGAGVAAAGFAVARLLITPPDDAFLGRLADPTGRQSWPIRDPATMLGLRTLAEPFGLAEVRADWARLFEPGADPVPLRESEWVDLPGGADQLVTALEQRYAAAGVRRAHVGACPADHISRELMYLAHLAARLERDPRPVGQRGGPRPEDEILDFATTHLDRFAGDALEAIRARATTPPMRALPDLAVGVLDSMAALVATSAAGGR